MSKYLIRLLRKFSPEVRLLWASRIFIWSIVLGTVCTVFISKTAFERILMAISWGAITITALDVVLTADVRDSQDE